MKLKFLFIFCSFLIQFSLQAKEVVVIDAEDSWAPYSWKENEKPVGFAVDIVKAIYDSVNVDVEFRSVSYAKCISDVTHESDVVACFDTVKNSENGQHLNWPKSPLFFAKVLIWARNDYKKSKLTYMDLIGHRVGVTNKFEYGSQFDNAPLNVIDKDDAPTNEYLFKKLLNERYDLAVAYELPGKTVLKDPKMKKEKEGIKVVGELSNLALYVSFSKKNLQSDHFLSLYNLGLENISKNGKLQKLISNFESVHK